MGREQFLQYFKDAVDLGDTPEGAGRAWIEKTLELPISLEKDGKARRGDGTREELERVARETGVFLIVGLVERCAGTLYCGVVYVCPQLGMLGKRRKVMPTGSERLIWGQGQPSSLRAITTTIRGVKLTLAAAICWENYMPLLRQSLYSQDVNLYLAPTADGRDTWLPLMRTIACEGRCFVLSANQCVKKDNLPAWIMSEKKESTGAEQRLTTGVTKSPPRLRRKSTIIEDGNEIALPCPKEGNIANGSQGGPRLRRHSTITENGHEIVLPASTEDKLLEETGKENYDSANDNPAVSQVRRKSTKITDGNEIALPNSKLEQEKGMKTELSEYASHGGSCIVSPSGEVLASPLWDDENGLLTVDVDFEDCLRGRLDLDVGGSYSRNDSFRLTVDGLDLSPPP